MVSLLPTESCGRPDTWAEQHEREVGVPGRGGAARLRHHTGRDDGESARRQRGREPHAALGRLSRRPAWLFPFTQCPADAFPGTEVSLQYQGEACAADLAACVYCRRVQRRERVLCRRAAGAGAEGTAGLCRSAVPESVSRRDGFRLYEPCRRNAHVRVPGGRAVAVRQPHLRGDVRAVRSVGVHDVGRQPAPWQRRSA